MPVLAFRNAGAPDGTPTHESWDGHAGFNISSLAYYISHNAHYVNTLPPIHAFARSLQSLVLPQQIRIPFGTNLYSFPQ